MFWHIVAGIAGIKLIKNIHKANEKAAEKERWQKEGEEWRRRTEAEKERKRREEEERRKNSPFSFPRELPKSQFEGIVKNTSKRIRRIEEVNIEGPVIKCKVIAQSGISDWWFTLDFNDFGSLSGKYWLWSDNDDSSIPQRVADNISEQIKELLQTGSGDNNYSTPIYEKRIPPPDERYSNQESTYRQFDDNTSSCKNSSHLPTVTEENASSIPTEEKESDNSSGCCLGGCFSGCLSSMLLIIISMLGIAGIFWLIAWIMNI